jgi:hypothetical protein
MYRPRERTVGVQAAHPFDKWGMNGQPKEAARKGRTRAGGSSVFGQCMRTLEISARTGLPAVIQHLKKWTRVRLRSNYHVQAHYSPFGVAPYWTMPLLPDVIRSPVLGPRASE